MNICECEKLNPLYRDGTSQLQRLIDTLDTSYVSVDERSLEDLLLYIKKHSEYLRYVDSTDETASGSDWLSFIENDVTVFIADIVKSDTVEIRNDYNNLYQNVIDISSKNNLVALFNFLIDIASKIDYWYSHSVIGLSLYKDLDLIIKSSLKTSLADLFSCYKGAASKLSYSTPIEVPVYKFSSIWEIDSTNNYEDIAPYTSELSGNNKENITKVVTRLNSIFEVFYNAVSKIVSASTGYMTEALEKYPQHQPHFALLLAFIKLFKYAQDNINRITKRHLDFYYKDVLHLKEKDEVPDQVHLIFELAKNFTTYTLKKGTLLKAGKDDSEKEVSYQTDKELVVNNAIISTMKTVFIDKYTEDEELLIRNIYAASTANSADGNGKKFTDDEEKWHTFGESQWDDDKNCYIDETSMTMNFADIGFAIASPQFILKEGTRKITLIISVSPVTTIQSAQLQLLTASNFKFYFSGKKKWIDVESSSAQVSFAENKLTFTLTLAEDQPEITIYDQSKLGGTFDTNYPILKILLDTDNNPYGYLKDLQIAGIDINVSVTGIKNLILQNDIGKLDAKKPFQPFGNAPVLGSAFYIGSEEIFNKSISMLDLNLTWLNKLPATLGEYYGGYIDKPSEDSVLIESQILDKKTWADVDKKTKEEKINTEDVKSIRQDNLFPQQDKITYYNLLENRAEEIEKITEFNYDLVRGFIKLSLAGHDLCHKDYANVLTSTIVNNVKTDTNNDGTVDKVVIPKEPYTPLIKSISVDYDSNESFNDEFEQFFHIYPFGEVETSPLKTSSSTANTTDTLVLDTKDFLPQFKINNEEQEGVLYLGISKLVPPQNLSLLFQVAEGSGDPNLKVPDINWRYLSNNQWKQLEKSKILSDTTNSFKITGLIEFDFPSDATSTNTIMPAGYNWLSASVAKDSAAVNQMIEIIAQACTASFKNNGNDPNYLLNPLEAKIISKLETRVPEIKSVTQPFASFGGKIKEQSDEFYRRVSERLRHKNRAVNIWDYERLVLENFASIYKVKCINHTGTDSEIYPGCVTIIPISNLRNKNAVDILEPRTSANTLDEIKEYLGKYNSTFIKLEVENPKYEKIKTKFNVKFYKGIDKGTYTNTLKENITKFLSPWAFDEGYDITFGGKIHASYIINFIEELSYVDYITDFEMYHIVDETIPSNGVEAAETTSAKSILVSYDNHEISIID